MKKIIELLQQNPQVNDWRILENSTESYELFFIHDQLETVRKTDTCTCTVTVYVDHQDFRGNSTFTVYASDTPDDLAAKIQSACAKAALVCDRPYALPSEGTLKAKLPSNLEGRAMSEIAAEVGRAVLAAGHLPTGGINALEVFVKKTTVHVQNSRGIDKEQVRHSVAIEAIPTYNGEKESVELYEYYDLSTLDLADLSAKIKGRMQDVSARGVATRPTEGISCPVLLTAGELRNLFGTVAYDRGFYDAYAHTNLLSPGDLLQTDPQGDRITITMRDHVEGSPAGSYFDADGTALVPCTVIKDGKVVANFGGSRFAQYLGCEPTGELPICQVDGGATPEAALRAVPHLECVYMSGLQVDTYSDYIGGEVRLAYYFDGTRRVPITGISISAKLSHVLNHLRLSSETTVQGRYAGPAAALLEGFNIF